MSQKFALRTLIILSVLLFSIYVLLPFFYTGIYTVEEIEYLYYQPSVAPVVFPSWLGWLMYGLFMVCYLLLYNGFYFVRNIFLLLILVDFSLIFLSGIHGTTGLERFLSSGISILDGLILATLYGERFLCRHAAS
jgi:hypothetical protein